MLILQSSNSLNMRLSESLRKNIIDVSVGRVVNRFKLKERRITLFFEEILAYYIKKCEDAGYAKETRGIGKQWGFITTSCIMPKFLRKVPITTLVNTVAKRVWINMGLIDDIRARKEGEKIIIKTKGEFITRCVGKNEFMSGARAGMIQACLGCSIKNEKLSKSGEWFVYSFVTDKKPFTVRTKKKSLYYKLNRLSKTSGITLKQALKKDIFHLKKNNRIYFRGRPLVNIENTVFHLIGDRAILMDKVAKISYDYFNGLIKKSSATKKLFLLKIILHAMGWGVINISYEKNKVRIRIDYPPYGFQTEKDNWKFLVNVILGYVWLINKKFRIKKFKEGCKKLEVLYSI